jgi:DNA-binding LacI/PurR family transcriptional regulator
MRFPIRIQDVAQRAGVSSATVSRVLANKPHVSLRVRKLVMAAIEELDYQPSRVAHSLRVQTSKIIGLIISDIQNPFFTSLVRAVEDVTFQKKESGYRFTRELLDRPQPPTALFAGNNLLTVGAQRAIEERSLRIPEDIAVGAFDDVDWMYRVGPVLGVAVQPTYDIGWTAAELLIKRIGDKTRPIQTIVRKPTIRKTGSHESPYAMKACSARQAGGAER